MDLANYRSGLYDDYKKNVLGPMQAPPIKYAFLEAVQAASLIHEFKTKDRKAYNTYGEPLEEILKRLETIRPEAFEKMQKAYEYGREGLKADDTWAAAPNAKDTPDSDLAFTRKTITAYAGVLTSVKKIWEEKMANQPMPEGSEAWHHLRHVQDHVNQAIDLFVTALPPRSADKAVA
jgi:hypothetical protein